MYHSSSHEPQRKVTGVTVTSASAKNLRSFEIFQVLWKTDHVDYGKRGPRFTAWKAVAKLMEIGKQS